MLCYVNLTTIENKVKEESQLNASMGVLLPEGQFRSEIAGFGSTL